MTDVLPDVLGHGLIVVFCGTAASNASAAAGAYYANPGNRFWSALYSTGITPRLFDPRDFRKLFALRIGLTDLAKRAVGSDRDLSASDFDSATFAAKIQRWQPQIVAFTSKRAFHAWRGPSPRTRIDYGWQAEMIGATKLFVLPSPSGAARRYWDISHWKALASAYQAQMAKGFGIANACLPQ